MISTEIAFYKEQSWDHANDNGFTMVETVIVVLLASLIMFFIYDIMISGMHQTIHGTERLVTVKDAAILFAAIRKDLLSSIAVYTKNDDGTPLCLSMPGTMTDFPEDYSTYMASHLEFGVSLTATASYIAMPDNKCVMRIYSSTGKLPETTRFALPRLRLFRSLVLLQEHRAGPSMFDTRHLFVEIELQPDEKEHNRSPIRLSSVFSTPNLGLSPWNFHFSPKP